MVRKRNLPALGKATVEEHDYNYMEEKGEEKGDFFATEPVKSKRSMTQHRKQK